MSTTAILRHRRDTAANWTSSNPILKDGQIGYETDTRRFKFGDGTTAWNSIPYVAEERTFGADNTGVVECSSLWNAALDAGETIVLGPHKTYLLQSGLVLTANGGAIIGDGTATIIMDKDYFNNTSSGAPTYGTTACGIYIEGLEDIILNGFTIRPSAYVDGVRLRAVGVKGALNSIFERIAVEDFALGAAIALNDLVKCDVRRLWIHNCTSDDPTGNQVTGLGVDVDGTTDSSDSIIAGCHIEDITVGTTFFGANGYQATGIQFAGRDARRLKVVNNTIVNTGQCIDNYASESVFSANVLKDAYTYGFSLKHGASNNVLSGHFVRDAGLAGINIDGTNTGGDTDLEGNLIDGNYILGINTAGNYTGGENLPCIQYSAGTVGNPIGNVITNNILDGGGTGKSGIYSNASAGSGQVISGNTVRNVTDQSYDLASGTYSVLNDMETYAVETHTHDAGDIVSGDLINSVLLGRYDQMNGCPNGTLEAGDVGFTKQTGWSIDNDSANAYSGNYVGSNDDTSGTSYELRSEEQLAVYPGDKVYAGAMVKTSASPTLTRLRVTIRWLDKDGTLLSNSNGDNITSEQLTYTLSSVTGEAPASAAFAQVAIQTQKTVGTVYADQIELFKRRSLNKIANVTVGPTEPSNPQEYDVWFETSA